MQRLLLTSAALAALATAPAPALAAPAGLDAGFGDDGVAKVDFATPQGVADGFYFADSARAVATGSDGKIVVVGDQDRYNAITDVGATDFAIARLNPDGSLDETFGSGGKRVIDFKPTGSDSWEDRAKDVIVQPDGKIVVGGQSQEKGTLTALITVTRLNTDGSTDLTFGNPVTPGVNHIGLGGDGTVEGAVAQYASGKFIVAGTVFGSTSTDIGWAGLTQLGRDEPVAGTLTYQGASADRAVDVATTPDGNFVMAGSTTAPPGGIAVVRRKGSDGSQDNTFSGDGKTTITVGGAEAVAVQPDNKVLTAGGVEQPARDFVVHRLDAFGAADTSFGSPANNGTAFIDFGAGDRAVALGLLPDGKVAVAGQKDNGPDMTDVAAARLTPGGALDASFGVGGKRVIELPGPQDAHALAVQPDAGLLVAGRTAPSGAVSGSDFFVMRIGPFTPRPGVPGSAPPPSPSQPRPSAPRLARVAISAKSLEASAKGVVGVKLSCSAAAACAGTVDLTTAGKVSVAAKKPAKKRTLGLGRKSFSIRAGKSQTVKVKLNRTGLRVLRKQRKLRVRLTVTTRRARAAATKASKTVTLKAAPKKKRKR